MHLPSHQELRRLAESNKFVAKGVQFAITPKQYAIIRRDLGLDRANEICRKLFGCELVWISKQTAKWLVRDIEEGNIKKQGN